MDLDKLRRNYTRGGLKREDLDDDPVTQFKAWLKQAIDAEIKDPTGMVVSTVDEHGQPSQRMVLLKQVDHDGFCFFTNYGSKKASDIGKNPLVSLHFPWHMLDRQVKICGRAEKMTKKESLDYFMSRPRESQLAAWASAQSDRIPSRQLLMQQIDVMKRKFQSGDVPLPDFWGGYRLTPSSIEFWQGGEHRVHDRFRYDRDGDDWDINRLSP